jgi:gluconolactonase
VSQASPVRTRDLPFPSLRRLVRVVATDAHEGPVYVPAEDALYFTSVPRRGGDHPVVAVRRLGLDGHRFPLEPERVSTVREDANAANGMALDREGRLVVCEQGTQARPAAVTRAGRPLADGWNGLPLNSPNDVAVKSDGSIWFTDPSYGWLQGFRPEPLLGDHVYRCDPATGALEVAADGFDKPNGLCFSPDERVLYVSDNGAPHHLKAFDVLDGARLANERVIAVSTPLHPDGLKTDPAGRIYASFSGGVHVLTPTGALLGEIALPGAVNFCFGTAERDVLFITTDDAIWAAELAALRSRKHSARPSARGRHPERSTTPWPRSAPARSSTRTARAPCSTPPSAWRSSRAPAW